MTHSRKLAVAVYSTPYEARRAVDRLHQAGFTDEEIGFVSPDDRRDAGEVVSRDTNATEGAVAGMATGAGIGGLWALGIAAGMLPAVGPAVAGGLLASVVTSAAAGAATAGLVGALVGLGIPEEEAQGYENQLRSGKTILTVRAGDRYAIAHAILTNLHEENLGSARTTSPMTEGDITSDISNRDEYHSDITPVEGNMFAGSHKINQQSHPAEPVANRATAPDNPDFPRHNAMLGRAEDHDEQPAQPSSSSDHTTLDVPVHGDLLGSAADRGTENPNETTDIQKEVRVPVREEQKNNTSQPVANADGSDVKRFEDQPDMDEPGR